MIKIENVNNKVGCVVLEGTIDEVQQEYYEITKAFYEALRKKNRPYNETVDLISDTVLSALAAMIINEEDLY